MASSSALAADLLARATSVFLVRKASFAAERSSLILATADDASNDGDLSDPSGQAQETAWRSGTPAQPSDVGRRDVVKRLRVCLPRSDRPGCTNGVIFAGSIPNIVNTSGVSFVSEQAQAR